MNDEINQKAVIESGTATPASIGNTGRMYTTNPNPYPAISSLVTPHSYKMVFKDAEGKTAEIKLENGKVVYVGDLPIDETADLFFKNVLMTWRNFGQDEDYVNARVSAAEAGYTDNDRIAAVIRDLADYRDCLRTVMETIRYEARQEKTERFERIVKYTERALGISKP